MRSGPICDTLSRSGKSDQRARILKSSRDMNETNEEQVQDLYLQLSSVVEKVRGTDGNCFIFFTYCYRLNTSSNLGVLINL